MSKYFHLKVFSFFNKLNIRERVIGNRKEIIKTSITLNAEIKHIVT